MEVNRYIIMISQKEVNAVLEVLQTIHAFSNCKIAQSVNKPRSFGSLCRDCQVKVIPSYLKKALIKHGIIYQLENSTILLWNPHKVGPNEKLARFMIEEARRFQNEILRKSYARNKSKANNKQLSNKMVEIVDAVVNYQQTLQNISDKELVAELRRRGYTVTAILTL